MGKKIKRVATAVATGGLSEAGNLLQKATKSAQIPGGGSVDISSEPFNIEKELASTKEGYGKQLEQAIEAQNKYRTAGTGLTEQLGEAALGKGPSLAAEQLKAAQERNLAQQIAAVQAGRGGSSAANQRALIQSMSQGGRQVAQDAAQARLQETSMARDRFLQAQAAADQQAREDLLQVGDLNLAQKKASQQFELARAGQAAAIAQENLKNKTATKNAIIGGITSMGGSALSALKFSDKNLKTDIKDAKKDVEKFMAALKSQSYKYKDGQSLGEDDSKRYGIMAQDLEKSKVGKSMVKNTEMGKMVDLKAGYGAVLASLSNLNSRLAEIEKKKKK